MRYRILLAVGLALANLSFPAVARADCQPASSVQEALANAEVAFVGTVVAAVQGEPGASFLVDEVWVGNLPPTTEVRGIGDAGFLEDDRRWIVGVRYLVIPYVDGAVLRDNICTATLEWTDELAALKPQGAQGPDEGQGGSDRGISGELLGVAAALLLLGIVGFIAFRDGSPLARR